MRASLLVLLSLIVAGCTVINVEKDGAGTSASRKPGQSDDPATSAKANEPRGPDGDDDLPAPVPGSGSKRMIGYFAEWGVYGRNYHVADIPAAKLTHINYGFANLSPEGECILGDPYAATEKPYPGDSTEPGAPRGTMNQLKLLKQRNPHLKALISVGGWTWSQGFSAASATDAGRKKLASSCVAFMQGFGFDGIDVDWEYPISGGLHPGRPEDKANYTLLLAEFRKQLPEGALLTIAAPAAPKVIANLEIEKITPIIDWYNVMAYDFHGSWETKTNFNAALFSRPGEELSVDAAAKTYRRAKVPTDKLVIGLPLYGRGYAKVEASATSGLDQAFTGMPEGSFEPGIFDFKDLVKNHIPRATRHFDPVAKAPWLYDAATKTFISYDDAESIRIKGQYIHDNGLGGAMFWELSGDDVQASLVEAVRAKL